MLTSVETSDEILPGYFLVDRLGAGGYAEVWRVRAPGGMQKAVKIVYGYHDEELATQELKAIERIKDVRHPFLLSLERFEVVDGRLVILTELADMSLDQRATKCRAEGMSGIPRDELLRYLQDAAEALDYLIERCALQHLDVKPENLLLLCEHLKVADFGLVKELASRTQNSMIAGMTPTYAAPEMFDDNPSHHSDQYSLAIVYQAMLTGSLPFPGRTAAQLAKQHTLSPPQLSALPAGDRDVVAKALAKDPNERFPNCRAFVEALRSASGRRASDPKPTPPPLPKSATQHRNPSEETRTGSSEATIPRGQQPAGPAPRGDALHAPTQPQRPPASSPAVSRTEPVSPAPRLEMVAESIDDVSSPPLPASPPPTPPVLYVAVGGSGIRVASRLHELIKGKGDSTPAWDLLAIDTDRQELKKFASSSPGLSPDSTVHTPLRLPMDYDSLRNELAWLSRRWLYNIPRSLETRGYRPLGRVALVDHCTKVAHAIEQRLRALAANSEGPLRVVVLCGMGGGTGGGMLVDLGALVRNIATQMERTVEMEGVLLTPPIAHTTTSPLATANTFATLSELRHAMLKGNQGILSEGTAAHPLECPSAPFDYLYCIPSTTTTQEDPREDAAGLVANYLSQWHSSAAVWLMACREASTPREQSLNNTFHLRTMGYASLTSQWQEQAEQQRLALERNLLAYWASAAAPLPTPEPAAPSSQETEPTTPSESLAATPDMLRARFGPRASTCFAHHVVDQAIATWPLEASDDETADRRRLATVGKLARTIDLLAVPTAEPGDEGGVNEALLEQLSQEVLARTFADPAALAGEPEACAAALRQKLHDVTHQHLASADSRDTSNHDTLAATVLAQASTALLTCGHDRRTLALLPNDPAARLLAEAIQGARPTLEVMQGEFADHAVLCEGSGISPQSFAVRLAKIYPDIAEAAGRLHTRTDLQWSDILAK